MTAHEQSAVCPRPRLMGDHSGVDESEEIEPDERPEEDQDTRKGRHCDSDASTGEDAEKTVLSEEAIEHRRIRYKYSCIHISVLTLF